jgi:hypothetical protein
MASSLIYWLQELVIMFRLVIFLDKYEKIGLLKTIQKIYAFNNRIALGLALVQLVYSVLLINSFFWVELFLPYINLLSWIKLIQELAQFEIIRKFLIVFMASI